MMYFHLFRGPVLSETNFNKKSLVFRFVWKLGELGVHSILYHISVKKDIQKPEV